MLRWSLTQRRRIEALRDRILGRIGTNEALIYEDMTALNPRSIIGTWRKPLTIQEVNRMAQTQAVRARPGRP